LAFRWDGRRTRFFFQTQPGSYSDQTLIGFLRQLKRHFRGGAVSLIWDGLPAHRSRAMRAYLTNQRAWLTVERLPGYAPELNPVELVWGNLKRRELANVCAAHLDDLRDPLRRGCARVRRGRWRRRGGRAGCPRAPRAWRPVGWRAPLGVAVPRAS